MALVSLFSCSKVKDKCIVKGQLSGSDGEVIVLPYQEVQSKEEADSLSFKAEIVDGQFELELDSEMAARNLSISLGSEHKRYTLFSEPGVIRITEKDGKLIGEGSALNDEYQQLLEKLNYEIYSSLKYKKELSPEENGIKAGYDSKLWDLAKEYPNSIPLTKMFYELYWGADIVTLNKIINSFSEEIHDSYYIKKMIVRRDNQQRVAIGNQAPDFLLNSVKGEGISLKNYKGKYLLIDFWASWCGPCRAGIPNLKEIYQDYQSKGLEILSISTDADEKAWLKAVGQEEMPWVQIRDTKKVSDEYNITYIPMIFLIDPDGKIIDKGLHGDAIRNSVEKMLN